MIAELLAFSGADISFFSLCPSKSMCSTAIASHYCSFSCTYAYLQSCDSLLGHTWTCHTEVWGPATWILLHLIPWVDFSVVVSGLQWRARAQRRYFPPLSSPSTPGRKMSICEQHCHLCFMKSLQLLLFNQLFCLLLQFSSPSKRSFSL